MSPLGLLIVAALALPEGVEASAATGPVGDDTWPTTFAPVDPAMALVSSAGGDLAPWTRVVVSEPSAAGASRFLEVGSPTLARLSFWVDDADGHRRLVLDPDAPLSDRSIPSPYPTVVLRLDEAGRASALVRVDDPGPFSVGITVRDAAELVSAAEGRSWVIGVSLGFALLILLYNALMYLVTREREFGAYCLYLLPCVMITPAFGGLLGAIPGVPAGASGTLAQVLGSLIGVFAIHFVQVFLRTDVRFPRLDRWLTVAKLGAAVMLALHFVLPPPVEIVASIAITLLGVGLLLAAIVRALVDDPRGTAFFALAWGTLLLFILIGVVAMAGGLPLNAFTKNTVLIGQSLEYALLALAVADRINLLKAERERALEERLATAERNAALSSTFERYVPKEFLRELERPSILDIRRGDQTEKEMTVFFSDIRAFTSISEALSPREVFALINDYLAAMGPCFDAERGFIDKYIGDAIMALFAPGDRGDSADRAVRAAVANLEALRVLNRGRSSPLAIGIGIHTGTLMLGMVGSEQRLSATVLGDSVNLASRVEGMTKSYGAEILITEATRRRLSGTYGLRRVDRVRVKGKHEPVLVYEVFEGSALEEAKGRTRERFEAALDAFQSGDLAAAEAGFGAVLEVFDDRAAKLYLDRCRHYRAAGLPEGWDGVVTLDTK